MSLPDFCDLKRQHKPAYRPYRINNSAFIVGVLLAQTNASVVGETARKRLVFTKLESRAVGWRGNRPGPRIESILGLSWCGSMGAAISGKNPALAEDTDPDKSDCCTMNTTGV
jgi:hypothetical protein